MANLYGITLDDASLRWAAAEGVPESVIAAICLLDEKSVGEIVARLTTAEPHLCASTRHRGTCLWPLHALPGSLRQASSSHPFDVPGDVVGPAAGREGCNSGQT